MSNKILLIDGMALLFRHFYATSLHKQFMRNSSGTPTNGIQGFVRHVFSAINDIQPTHVAVCWDMGKSTFRNDMFDGYKQNRPAPPEELIPQFDYVKEVSNQFGFVNIGVQNYEADDVIGTLAHQYSDENQIYVVTGDKDILQCINPNVEIWLTKKGFSIYNRYTLDRFQSEYGLNPLQLIDVKAFMGDSADGYPGVKGIGEKTAIKLIQNYGSVESVVDAIDELTPGQQNKISNDMQNLKVSKSLAKIHTEVPLDTTTLLQDMKFGTDITKILNICNEHELYVSGKYLSTHFS
ncbi:MAG: 5'-3' exonuclease [Staphylococcus equorum]|uniref:5'-3' exonuclease n=1 Tax=Staphylococcus equorum TaxID=246432 RepID=A0AAW7AGU0_9STAP|nr:5'-3' exonuclease H3TH domain-containing protein [Staphylococcus equorum]KKI54351.1 DNA polymerase I [Staphylococcus equorum subsp. equorum]MDG0822100.1 5'-3' exonuclease [Staphylococcus equorum]MDK9865318.1 5'-3' exonuclease H3TH domain-containing protein [Staphylococcus equorum]MDK9870839.1 5'-3' exonuclease H3TH domain-containing protein [Staphylococcus equorum]MDK9876237.1 5'-3' exonuclease H3TH domain-containing protein [Staphylococcus equorum]